MKRRLAVHDYSQPCFYMITIMVCSQGPRMSEVSEEGATTALTGAGLIVRRELYELENRFPVKIRNSVVMPDHIHFIVEVVQTLTDHFGRIIGSFKGRCSSAYWEAYPEERLSKERLSIWEKNYNDKVVYGRGQLPRFVHYVLENPRRYLIRKHLPEYFYLRWKFQALGQTWHAIGNIFLLDHPIREAVKFSRSFSDEEWGICKEFLRHTARHGDVVVSTFIHPEERQITKECTQLGASLIWIKNDGFPERSAVKGEEAYSLCALGRLLMIAPERPSATHQVLTRADCLRLNALARLICGGRVELMRVR